MFVWSRVSHPKVQVAWQSELSESETVSLVLVHLKIEGLELLKTIYWYQGHAWQETNSPIVHSSEVSFVKKIHPSRIYDDQSHSPKIFDHDQRSWSYLKKGVIMIIKSGNLKSTQILRLAILPPFLAIFLPPAYLSFTKFRCRILILRG